MNNFFINYTNLTEIVGLDLLDTSNVTTLRETFRNCSSLTNLDLSNFNTSKVTNMYAIFMDCTNLKTIDLSSFNTSQVTSFERMFSGNNSLTSIDLSSFNTSSLTNMNYMFFYCKSLVEIDLSNFDTSKVTTMKQLFHTCNKLETLDLSSFNTSNVDTPFDYMFNSCSSLKHVNLSSFNTSKVPSMTRMFYGCSSLEELDVTSFDTSSVTSMNGMFAGCTKIKALDLSNFDTSNVQNMSQMFFHNDSITTFDLSNFDTSKVTNMNELFIYCASLKNIILGEDFEKITGTDVFKNCSNLERIIIKSDSVLDLEDTVTIPAKAKLYVIDSSLENQYELEEVYQNSFASTNDTEDDMERISSYISLSGEKIVTKYLNEEYEDAGAILFGDPLVESGETNEYTTEFANTLGYKAVISSNVDTSMVTSGENYNNYTYILNDKNNEEVTRVTRNVKVEQIIVPTYTVTFDFNGGISGDVENSITEYITNNVTIPTKTPTKEGYNFKGWGLTADTTTISYNVGDTYTNKEDITLYAIWKSKIYNILD